MSDPFSPARSGMKFCTGGAEEIKDNGAVVVNQRLPVSPHQLHVGYPAPYLQSR